VGQRGKPSPPRDAGALRSARALLEVSADADVAELTRAYWRQARRLHPDRSSDPQATQQFQALHDAYRLILDAAPDTALDTTPDSALHSPPQPGDQQSAHGQSTEPTGTPGTMAGTTQATHRSRHGRTRPPQPATPPPFTSAGSGWADGVWVVAGPVHVWPPRGPGMARTHLEGCP
jgi:hypothetical protein